MKKDYKKLYEDLRGKIQDLHDRQTGELQKEIEEEFPEIKERTEEQIKEHLIKNLEFSLKGAEEQDASGCSRQKDIEAYKWGINHFKQCKTPKWLYRLEYKDGTCGLWYNGEGKWCFEKGIGSLVGCKTKDLPMDHDERYKQDGRDWFSSCSRKEDLMHWYSLEDAKELIKKGFVFTRYLATEYHEYENETVFIKESSLVREVIDIFELFGLPALAKFKEGDWVVNEKDGTFHQIENVIKYDEKKLGTEFTFTDGGWISKSEVNNYHLWTIKDAKPGDIVVTQNSTLIYKESKSERDYISYFAEIDIVDGTLLLGSGARYAKYCYPATIDQRRHFLQKIKESGYEWDAEKKELKKTVVPIFNVGDIIIKKHNSDIHNFASFTITDIKDGKYWYNDGIICYITKQNEWELYEPVRQKTAAWTPMDEQRVENLLAIIEGHGYPGEVEWLNSLKDRIQPKQEWSEEDERIRIETIELLETANHPNVLHRNGKALDFTENINWLKSLKDRILLRV